MKTFNIYCDESCHLENDRQQVMLLGAVWCSNNSSRNISKEIKAIKKKHGLSPTFEIKWTKVSPAKIDFYMMEKPAATKDQFCPQQLQLYCHNS